MTQIKNFNVGPSNLFPAVVDFLKKSIEENSLIIPHRSPQFSNISKNTDETMRDFFKIPKNYKIFYTYSATQGMEIILRSIDDITFINNGDFGDLFESIGKSILKTQNTIKKNRGERVEISEIKNTKDTLLFTANDTSTGIEYSPEEFTQIRKTFPKQNIVIDATSSFGARDYDISSADAWIFSVQKNLGLPPGLGILIVNEKIINKVVEKENNGEDVGGHHRITNLLSFQENNHTPSTPNILLIGALGFVVSQYKKVFGSIENIEKITKEKASSFYDLIEKNKNYSILHKGLGKSQTTFVLDVTSSDNTEIIQKLKNNGFQVSPGYGKHKAKQIRIANFPVHRLDDIKKLLEIL